MWGWLSVSGLFGWHYLWFLWIAPNPQPAITSKNEMSRSKQFYVFPTLNTRPQHHARTTAKDTILRETIGTNKILSNINPRLEFAGQWSWYQSFRLYGIIWYLIIILSVFYHWKLVVHVFTSLSYLIWYMLWYHKTWNFEIQIWIGYENRNHRSKTIM